MSVENYHHGLRPLSIVLALPQGLAIYSGMSFSLALVVFVNEKAESFSQVALSVLVMMVAAFTIVGTLMFFDPSLRTRPVIKQIFRALAFPIKGHVPSQHSG